MNIEIQSDRSKMRRCYRRKLNACGNAALGHRYPTFDQCLQCLSTVATVEDDRTSHELVVVDHVTGTLTREDWTAEQDSLLISWTRTCGIGAIQSTNALECETN